MADTPRRGTSSSGGLDLAVLTAGLRRLYGTPTDPGFGDLLAALDRLPPTPCAPPPGQETGPVPGESAFFRAQADAQRREAAASDLVNVRERCERAAAKWDDMADRVERAEKMRAGRPA